MLERSLIPALMAALAALEACGGKVVVEVDPPDLARDCTELCAATDAAGCSVTTSCASDCEQLVEQAKGECEEELSALLRCTSAELAGTSSRDRIKPVTSSMAARSGPVERCP